MKRARDRLSDLARSLTVDRVYADLDGTLVGPGGSLFAHPDGPTGAPAEALAAMARAGVGLVLMSGRTREQVREAARILGADAYICELGGLLVHRDGRDEVITRNFGSFAGLGTPFEAIQRSGAAGYLLTAFPGRLEPHAPWAFLPRECSVLLRGRVPPAEVDDALGRSGYGWLDLVDNGIIPSPPGRFPGLDVDEVHAYHLVPTGVSKASAVAIDRSRLGLEPSRCIALGDSASDVAVAEEVGAVFLVANGEPAVRGVSLPDNAYLLDGSHGLGFAEALIPFLADRPGH